MLLWFLLLPRAWMLKTWHNGRVGSCCLYRNLCSFAAASYHRSIDASGWLDGWVAGWLSGDEWLAATLRTVVIRARMYGLLNKTFKMFIQKRHSQSPYRTTGDLKRFGGRFGDLLAPAARHTTDMLSHTDLSYHFHGCKLKRTQNTQTHT